MSEVPLCDDCALSRPLEVWDGVPRKIGAWRGVGYMHRGSSLARTHNPLVPYRRTMPRVLGGS